MSDGYGTSTRPLVQAADDYLCHKDGTLSRILAEDAAAQLGVGTGGGGGRPIGVLEYPDLRQRLMCSLLTGYNDGTTNTEIFSGAGRAPQGMATLATGGGLRVFTLQRVSGATYAEDERHRIVEWHYATDGSAMVPIAWSGILNVGHQGLSATLDGGTVWLWAQLPIASGHTGLDAGKGLSRIEWKGGATSQADVTSYQVFGYAGSGHPREYIVKASPAVSADGSTVAFISHDLDGDVNVDDPDLSDGGRTVTLFRLADILEAGDPLDAVPIASWAHPGFRDLDDHINQAAALDSQFIYTLSGWTNPLGWHTLFQLDHQGNLLRKVRIPSTRAAYTLGQLMDGVGGNTCVSMEPEGLGFDLDGNLLVLLHAGWNAAPSIVSFSGRNFVCIKANTGISPLNARYWTRTAQAAGGAWSAVTAYTAGSLKTRTQHIYRVGPKQGEAGEQELSAGVYSVAPTSAVHLPISPVDISFEAGFDFTIADWNANTRTYRRALQAIWDDGFWRFWDLKVGASATEYGGFTTSFTGGREYFGMRGRRNQTLGAWIQCYGVDDSSFGSQVRMGRGGDTTGSIVINSAGNVRSGYNGTQNLGAADYQWNNIYLVSNPIVSSDARLKTEIAPMSPDEIAAARDLAAEIGTYQWLSSIAAKGPGEARHHVGMTVQRAIEIMESHGLDPWRYGFICYDPWAGHGDRYDHQPEVKEVRIGDQVIVEAQEEAWILVEPARADGDLYSFRLDQLALFIARGQAARQDAIEARLAALEAA